ncbi:hypothetical protein [uncultured Nocardioides sp.]|jgi:phosphotriesterase-related protein|uniref:phosphotriesterase family protein n=1 Tax=uncultured Nocardioides sp. TaxID=198441 RepID=UPI000C3F0A51|nr:hypothetical protein [Nocardioides sp.]MCK5928935.1 hypothetical protein [Nocardioides sp.]|tara:strand:+ start:427 stop:1482 length:1056 start_codon:yes stop_codon:yes gene_type:complete
MGVVTTVLGDVDSADLGVVLPHEHLIANATAQWTPPAGDAELAAALEPYGMANRGAVQMAPFSFREALFQVDGAVALAELRSAVAAGVGTVVELSIPGIGREPAALRALAELTGAHVVMGCGEYVEFAHSPYVAHCSAEAIRDVLLAELVDGVGPDRIRPGIIGEIGTSNTPTEAELKVLSGAAMAQRETGVALNIHRSIFPDPMGALVAIDHVLALGVDPAKVVVSHVDERPEPEFALAAAGRGVFVELDTFGMEQWATSARRGDTYPRRALDHDRIDMLASLLDAGHLDQVLLSHDLCMKPQFSTYGGWGMAHLSLNIEPRLLARGIDKNEIARMRVDNPRRVLEREDR